MDIIGTILAVAKSLFDVRGILRAARRERRDRIAVAFERISETIEAVSTSLKRGEVPHGRCAEMQTYAEQLPGLINEELGDTRAKELGTDLYNAYEVERLLRDLQDAPDRAEKLKKLDETAGIFAALGNMMRLDDGKRTH